MIEPRREACALCGSTNPGIHHRHPFYIYQGKVVSPMCVRCESAYRELAGSQRVGGADWAGLDVATAD